MSSGKNNSPKEQQQQKLCEMPQWDLSDLYRGMDDPALERDLEKAREGAIAFEKEYQGRLGELAADGEGLGRAVEEYERLSELFGRMGSYTSLLSATDNQNEEIIKFQGDMQNRLTDYATHLLFFTLELNRLEEDELEAAIKKSQRLAHYRPWLEDLRREKPHQLSDELEKLFMEKGQTGRTAWNRLFDQTMTGLRFAVEGEKEELTLEAALNLMSDNDRERRRAAAQAISATLSENIKLFTLITNTLALDLQISNKWRHFDDIAASRHLDNRIEPEVVDALEQSVRDAYPRLSHRYYALKARWFGLEKLEYWDRNAPLPGQPRKIYSWEEARQIVLDAYSSFDPRMASLARPFFEKGWIDAPLRKGKSPGAFAHPSVVSVHPYVLLNYQGKARDVMTLAHELGHGVHQRLAAAQGELMSSTPLTLAETASVFGEMLTFRSMLDKAGDPAERKAILAGKVEDMINTVVRQIAFYSFERKLHTARREEGELTPERIGQLWMSVQGESLGPAINLGEGYEVYWSYIPHFIHSPFYVYAYAFGDCLTNSLYAAWQENPQGFADKYFDMLEAGGSRHHRELLAPFGLDASDPAFWNRGLGMIESLIDELEEMEAGSRSG